MRVVVAAPVPVVQPAAFRGLAAQLPDREHEHAHGEQNHAEPRPEHQQRRQVGQAHALQHTGGLGATVHSIEPLDGAAGPVRPVEQDVGDSGIRHDRCIGTYLHDALRRDAVLQELALKGRDRPEPYDDLARWFKSNASVPLFEELYL